MEPISGILSSAVHSPIAAAGGKEPAGVQRPEHETQGRSSKPVVDAYIPEVKQEPAGLYWLGKGGDGNPKIYFDDPEKPDELPNVPENRISGGKAESCMCSTDKVDREIETLKKQQAELEQQLNSETDETRIGELERKLAQMERELCQKDNDAYRRQHAEFVLG